MDNNNTNNTISKKMLQFYILHSESTQNEIDLKDLEKKLLTDFKVERVQPAIENNKFCDYGYVYFSEPNITLENSYKNKSFVINDYTVTFKEV